MSTKSTSASSVNKLVSDIGDVVTDVRDLYRDHGRQTAEDVVTLTAFAGIAQKGARRAYLWAARPVIRLEQRLAVIEHATLRANPGHAYNPGPGRQNLPRPTFQVRSRPTVGGRLQVDVEGPLPSDAELVFLQNGIERRGRVTRSSERFLRSELALGDVDAGSVDVWLKHSGGREPLTAVDVHAR